MGVLPGTALITYIILLVLVMKTQVPKQMPVTGVLTVRSILISEPRD